MGHRSITAARPQPRIGGAAPRGRGRPPGRLIRVWKVLASFWALPGQGARRGSGEPPHCRLAVARAVCLIFVGTAALLPAQVNILGYWWENPLPHQAVPKGLRSLRAADCGVCHQEIYQEWQVSTHAHALSDRQFQAEMEKSPETRWLCLNCHTPLENQLPAIAIGVRNNSTQQPIWRKNADFDEPLSREGVTCAVCHVRDGVVLGPWGDSKAPHPVRKDPKLLDEQTCAACHQATAAYTDTLVCTFDTAEEWRRSPYAAKGQSCTDCHMPAVERAVAPGGPVRHSRRHLFIGSKIPKEPLPAEHRKYYELFDSGLAVDVVREGGALRLVVQNARAGHLLPTGDPERYILIKTALLDARRAVLREHTYRIGQEWVWHPKARKLSDNRLKPLEERRVDLGARPGRAVRYRVIVENWRMNEQNAAYHKLAGYPLFAEVQRVEKPLP
jgi:nitrate/TMAO reductase-like tetraheme cytochrome c subunit